MIVEVLDARGRVVQRIPVAKDGFTVGRSLENDVIVEDPHLDVVHARFDCEEGEAGGWTLTDLESMNGTNLAGTRLPAGGATRYEPGTPIRIGETTIRLVTVQADAVRTVPINRKLLGRFEPGWAQLGAGTAVAALVGALILWLSWYEPDPELGLLAGGLGVVFGVAVWGGVWALGNRIFGGRANFRAHATIAAVSILGFALTGTISGFASFAAPGSTVMRVIGSVLGTFAFVLPLLAHVDVVSSRSIRFKVSLVAGITIGLTSLAIPASRIPLGNAAEVQNAMTAIHPFPAALVATRSVDEFAAELGEIEQDLENDDAPPATSPDTEAGSDN